jgi:hypothetical protein
MTAAEIASTIIATLSLVVSLITAYLTLLSRFKGMLLPQRRVILTQIDGMPCLVLDCEFINDGAKAGSIEDVLVKLTHIETGSQFTFAPFLVRDQFNIFQRYINTDFSPFSAILIPARSRREMYIVFRPMHAKFEPPSGKVVLRTSVRTGTGMKWINSPSSISLGLDSDISTRWSSPDGSPQQIQAMEISQSRKEYLEGQK